MDHVYINRDSFFPWYLPLFRFLVRLLPYEVRFAIVVFLPEALRTLPDMRLNWRWLATWAEAEHQAGVEDDGTWGWAPRLDNCPEMENLIQREETPHWMDRFFWRIEVMRGNWTRKQLEIAERGLGRQWWIHQMFPEECGQ